MATGAKRYCLQPGCRRMVSSGYCGEHERRPRRSREAAEWHKFYDAKWQRYRIAFLSDNPLCAECGLSHRLTPATVVDHIEPHRGDIELFWDSRNHQALCKTCHDRKTATEDGGFGRINGQVRE